MSPQPQPVQDAKYNPYAYVESSLALSWPALMKILDANMKAYQAEAELAQKTALVKGTAITACANATVDSFNAQSTEIQWQMGEAIAGAVTSGVSAGFTCGTFFSSKITSAQNELNNVTNFENDAKSVTGAPGKFGPTNPAQDDGVAQAARDFKNGNLSELGTVKSLDDHITYTDSNGAKATSQHTYREMLESEFASPSAKNTVMEKIAGERKLKADALTNASQGVNTWTSLVNMGTQAINSAASAGCKSHEADQKVAQGQASQDQQIAQASQEFYRQTGDSQQGQYSQYAQGTQQVFRSILEVASVDTRG
jgi:hypothetical protein